ncbi:MAG: family N-acetyltransferase [Devosia sp.]|nr:family N-acetyltransferase [Devosia sp.]
MKLATERLILREWEPADREPYASFQADPEVRKYFYPPTKTAIEVNGMVDRMIAALAKDGFGFLAAERLSDGAFIGEIGLTYVDDATKAAMDRPGDIEIGWLFGQPYWGHGYATEAAAAILDFAWDTLKIDEIVAFSAAGNRNSQRVMEKLGMHRDDQPSFEDPTKPAGHWLRPHAIHRIANPRR